MKTLSEILLEANAKQRQQLSKIIDKTIPSGIVEKRLDMIKFETPDAIISLVEINHMFKSLILSEVMLVEDMIATGIYKSKFGNLKCSTILNKDDFFPKDPNCLHKDKFKELLKKPKKKNKELLIDMTLFEASNSLTLGGKILLIELMDRDVVSSLITSNKTKYSKKELINTLEVCKKIRNHIAHNFFILNKGPYLNMVNRKIIENKNFDELETIKFLFETLEKILKVCSRGKILLKIKKKINDSDLNINLNHLDCLLLK